MATSSVNVLIKARDEASKKFGKIGKSATSMGGMIRKAAAIAAVYFGGREIKRFLESSVEAYAVQEDAERKLQQALISTGGAIGYTLDQLKEYASELQKTTKSSDELTIGAMSILATFKDIKGDVFKEATMLALDMSEALGQDLKSSVIQLGKALNDPATGISALSRVGVSFTEQQKKQIKAFAEANDIMSAQKIILKELSSEFGGQATAATNTYRGAMQQMKNAIGDVKEKIGEALVPMIIESAKKIKKWAEDNQDKIGEWAKKVMSYVELVKDIFMSFVDYMKTDWREGLAFAANSFVTIISESFIGIADLAYTSGKSALDAWLAGFFDDKSFEEHFRYEMQGTVGVIKQGMLDVLEQIKKDMPSGLGEAVGEAFAEHQKRLAAINAIPAPTPLAQTPPPWVQKTMQMFSNPWVQKALGFIKDQSNFVWKQPEAAMAEGGLMPGIAAQESRFLTLNTQRRYEVDIAKSSKQTSDNTKKANKTLEDIANNTKALVSASGRGLDLEESSM